MRRNSEVYRREAVIQSNLEKVTTNVSVNK